MRRGRAGLLAPAVVGALVLLVVPIVLTAITAGFEDDLVSPRRWVGLDNFRELADDPVFLDALALTGLFLAITVPLRMFATIALALALHRPGRGVGARRAAVALPAAVPDIATAVIWAALLNPLYGPVNGLLGLAGIDGPSWFVTPSAAFWAIVIMSVFTIGEGFVIALAARRELPGELFESARLAGASPAHVVRRVTLPLMAPTLLLLGARDVALVLSASFVPSYLITDGGPDRATLFLPTYVYDVGFEQQRYGYAAAMTLVLFVVTLVLVASQSALLRGRTGPAPRA